MPVRLLGRCRTPNHELTHADLPYSLLTPRPPLLLSLESTFRSGCVRPLPDSCHQVIHRPADQSLSVMPLVPSAATVRTGSHAVGLFRELSVLHRRNAAMAASRLSARPLRRRDLMNADTAQSHRPS